MTIDRNVWHPMSAAPRDGTPVELLFRYIRPGEVTSIQCFPPEIVEDAKQCRWHAYVSKPGGYWQGPGMGTVGGYAAKIEPLCWRLLAAPKSPRLTDDERALLAKLNAEFDDKVRDWKPETPTCLDPLE